MQPGPSSAPVQAQYQPRTASYAQRPPRALPQTVLRPPGASSQSTGRGGGGDASPPPACIAFLHASGVQRWRRRQSSIAAGFSTVGSPANTTGAGCGTASKATGGSSALASMTAPVHTQHGGVSVGLAVVAHSSVVLNDVPRHDGRPRVGSAGHEHGCRGVVDAPSYAHVRGDIGVVGAERMKLSTTLTAIAPFSEARARTVRLHVTLVCREVLLSAR